MKIAKHIPNFFTLMNLVAGFWGIVFAFQGAFLAVFYCIVIAAFFDFVDGGVARLLRAQSALGKELDSLCDLVSFGVVPGVVLFSMMRHALGISEDLLSFAMPVKALVLLFAMLLVPAFSALRLARFNVDNRQSDHFIGLPVPANALLIVSLGALWSLSCDACWGAFPVNPYFLLAVSLVQSYLLVAPLPMFALKFKNLKWKGNELRFSFLTLSLLFVLFFKIVGIVFTIVMYILISIVTSFFAKHPKGEKQESIRNI